MLLGELIGWAVWTWSQSAYWRFVGAMLVTGLSIAAIWRLIGRVQHGR